MGRGKGFDEDVAVAAAADLFWRQGYENTSLSQLLVTMHILNGSFYDSFGSKRALYFRALKKYNQTTTDRRLAAWAKEDNLSDGIRSFFAKIFRDLKSRKTPDGCMMTNSMQAEVLRYPELRSYIEEGVTGFEKFLMDSFEQAKQDKELPPDFGSEMAAGLLVTFLQGIFRVSNLRKNHKRLEAQTELLLQSLGL